MSDDNIVDINKYNRKKKITSVKLEDKEVGEVFAELLEAHEEDMRNIQSLANAMEDLNMPRVIHLCKKHAFELKVTVGDTDFPCDYVLSLDLDAGNEFSTESLLVIQCNGVAEGLRKMAVALNGVFK